MRQPPLFLPSAILLLLAERPTHGYALLERLNQMGFERENRGPVYRHLRALEDAKLLTSEWSEPEGGVHRVYTLTAAGREALAGCAKSIEELVEFLQQFLERHRAHALAAARQPLEAPVIPRRPTPGQERAGRGVLAG